MNDDTLVLGLAAGYHYGDVRPFLASLDHVGFTGMRVLFVSDTTRDVDRMEAHGTTILPAHRREGLEDVPYNGLRYFLYLDFLERHGPFERILIADVRDVIFQRHPFDYPWSDGINCTLEDQRKTVSSCPFNAHWVRQHMGTDALADIGSHPISCSGTTVGDHEGMLHYLRAMTTLLVPPTTGERMAGYDQGIHNHLIHTGQLPNVALHDNSGPILTLAQTKGEPPLDADGLVLNEAGNPAHIVHQYDRKPTLFKHIRTQYI